MGIELGQGLGSNLRKVPRLGKNRKIGDLKRLAEVSINGGACGLIRQYTGNLTSWSRFLEHGCLDAVRDKFVRRCCMAVVSSCREAWH